MKAWHEQARALKAADPTRSNASIGRELGHNQSAVWKALNPEAARRDNATRHEAKKAWQRAVDRSGAGRATCAECGGPCGVASKRKAPRICRGCHQKAALVRRGAIAGMWAAGLTVVEIAERLGTTRNTVGVEMARMRKDGWTLPYRHNWTPETLSRAQNSRRKATG